MKTFGNEIDLAMAKMLDTGTTVSIDCEVHGRAEGVKPPGVNTYRCTQCLEIELDSRAKDAIASGDATALPGWDEEE